MSGHRTRLATAAEIPTDLDGNSTEEDNDEGFAMEIPPTTELKYKKVVELVRIDKWSQRKACKAMNLHRSTYAR